MFMTALCQIETDNAIAVSSPIIFPYRETDRESYRSEIPPYGDRGIAIKLSKNPRRWVRVWAFPCRSCVRGHGLASVWHEDCPMNTPLYEYVSYNNDCAT